MSQVPQGCRVSPGLRLRLETQNGSGGSGAYLVCGLILETEERHADMR